MTSLSLTLQQNTMLYPALMHVVTQTEAILINAQKVHHQLPLVVNTNARLSLLALLMKKGITNAGLFRIQNSAHPDGLSLGAASPSLPALVT